ncbi:MAG TPA: carboxypeptidase-like regulatory domain-containing protein, partial [Terriglobales bacterium]
MVSRSFLFLFPLFFLSFASATTVSGVLRDNHGPVSGAHVVLSSTEGQFSASTSSDGRFSLSAMPAGDYTLSVSSDAITFKLPQPIHVNDGASLTWELQLSREQGVAAVRILGTNSASEASGGEHLSSGEVSSLPLNSRDFSKLLLLAAGTMTDANGAANFTQQFAVNGQRGSATVFAVDGADTTDPEMGGATFSNFNVDAIEEVQSNSGVMSADIGHGAASYTNVVSKSGTDQIHGSVFEFVRNAAFDARNYFDPSPSISHRRIPPFARNEFGFTNGGPVVLPGLYDGRHKTYYFGEYQGFRQVLGTTQVFPVPTAQERKGIDTTTYPGDTLTVPVNPAVAAVLAGYPLPNTPNGTYGPRTYAASSKVSTVTDQFSVRLDHHISEKAALLTRFSLNQVTGPITNPDQTAINPAFAVQFFDHQRNAEVKYARTISPHFTSQTSLGYIRSTPFFPAIDSTQPAINFGDGLFEGFNTAGGSIYGSYGNLYQLRHDMVAIRGPHTFKWGIEIRANRDATIFGVNPNGSYSFAGGTAYSPVFIPSASGQNDIQPGQALPDSLLGLLTATPYSYGTVAAAALTPIGNRFNEAGVRREAYDFYFMDTWKTTSRLTLTYGLRYEVNSRIHEADKRTSTMEFLDAAGHPASYLDRTAQQIFVVNPQPPYNQDWRGFGPRVGIDYSWTSNTVLHAGGAITTQLPNLWQDNFVTGGLPFVYSSSINAKPGVPVPFSNTVITETVPAAYSISGQPIFPAVLAGKLPANTILDLNRLQSDIDAQTPGNEVQLSPASGFARDFRNGYIASYTLGVDHNFRDVKFSAAYVATIGIHLPRVYFPNSYGGADPGFAPYTQFDSSGHPISGYGAETVMTSGSHSSYHSLQTSLSKNSARAGLGIQASYTYSKSLDDTSAVLGGLFGAGGVVLQTVPQNPWNPGAEKGPSTFDVTHVFTVSVIQLLPFDHIGFLRPLGKTLTSGWQFLNVTTLMTGSPFTVFSGKQQTGAGSGGSDRPDLVSTPHFSTSRTVRQDYFGRGDNNNTFFFIPVNMPGGTGPNQGRFGTLGRDTFRGPGFNNYDIALIKDTPFGHRGNAELGTIEFRAEFFNIFNIVNFGLPNNIVQGSGFGLISKTAGNS